MVNTALYEDRTVTRSKDVTWKVSSAQTIRFITFATDTFENTATIKYIKLSNDVHKPTILLLFSGFRMQTPT